MNRYELMLLLDTKEAKKDWDGLESHVQELIKKHGGEVVKSAKWDERKLVYEIKGQKRAVYYLAYLLVPPESIEPLRRDFTLSEKVMRNLFLRVDEFPEKLMTAQDFEDLRAAEDDLSGMSSRPPRPGGPGAATKPATETAAATGTATETATATGTATATAPASEAAPATPEAAPAETPAAAPATSEAAPAAPEAAPAETPEASEPEQKTGE